MLQRNDTVLYNFALNTLKLVKCECTLLLKKYGSFAWLTNLLLPKLTEVSTKKMMSDYRATLEDVVVKMMSCIECY